MKRPEGGAQVRYSSTIVKLHYFIHLVICVPTVLFSLSLFVLLTVSPYIGNKEIYVFLS